VSIAANIVHERLIASGLLSWSPRPDIPPPQYRSRRATRSSSRSSRTAVHQCTCASHFIHTGVLVSFGRGLDELNFFNREARRTPHQIFTVIRGSAHDPAPTDESRPCRRTFCSADSRSRGSRGRSHDGRDVCVRGWFLGACGLRRVYAPRRRCDYSSSPTRRKNLPHDDRGPSRRSEAGTVRYGDVLRRSVHPIADCGRPE
jgi:hypothetical protein